MSKKATRPRILLVRSEAKNISLQTRIPSNITDIISIPIISYQNISVDFRRFSRHNTLIVTSNYAANLISTKWLFPVDCYVVGTASANLLARNPHIKIAGIFDNVTALEEKLQYDSSRPSLYLRGNIVTHALSSLAKEKILYHTIYKSFFSADEYASLAQGIDYVVLYSEQSAKRLILLLKREGLLHILHKSVVIVISKKVARAIPYSQELIIADRPSAAAIEELLRAKLCI